MDAFLPWILEAIPSIPHSSSFRAMDVGSSEGANAIHAMQRIVETFRATSNAPMHLFFDDVPTNDFNRLSANLHPNGGSAFSQSEVYTACIGGSAFGRLVPAESLQVATTFNAIGFLEKRPDVGLPNYIIPNSPSTNSPRNGVSATEAEIAPFRAEAARDLELFYAARAAELVPGGRLLTQVFGRNEEVSTSHGIYDVLSDAVLDAVEDGSLPRETYENLVFPIVLRTIDELVAPVEEGGSIADKLTLERAESKEIDVPFNAVLQSGNVAEWARLYTGFLRAFTEAILAAALPSDDGQIALADRIYHRVESRLTEDPARYPFRYVSIAAQIRKI